MEAAAAGCADTRGDADAFSHDEHAPGVGRRLPGARVRRHAGLVAAQLRSVSTTFYVAPSSEVGSTDWAVTFEPREDAAPLPAGRVMALSGELATLAALCSFLQARSEAFLARA